MSDKQKIILLGLVVLVTFGFTISRLFSGGGKGAVSKVSTLATLAATALAEDVQDGQQVLLVFRDSDSPTLRAYVDGFRDTLADKRNVTFLESRVPKSTDDQMDPMGPVLPDAKFAGLVSPHSQADVVVSFIGVPRMGKKMQALWSKKKPLFCVLAVTRDNLADARAERWVDVALVMKKRKNSASNAVEDRYEIVRR